MQLLELRLHITVLDCKSQKFVLVCKKITDNKIKNTPIDASLTL